MFYIRRMHNAYGWEPYCGRGYGYGLRRGYGYRHFYEDDKAHLEFAKKELELRLEYLSKELEAHPDDADLNFAKRDIENRISYINDLIAKATK
ncbi:MAG TPA: hypothetical protein ENO30_05690 [Thermodesulfobium narugense]|nr:hypothetical protein [Thermodesulfobium narugense]